MTGRELRAAYLNRGMSRTQYAAHVGVPEASMRRLERGLHIHPGNAKRVADDLGVQVTDLMPLEPDRAA